MWVNIMVEWSFDSKVIPWVIDTKHDRKDGTVSLDCLAIGDFSVENIAEIEAVETRPCKYRGESIVLYNHSFIVEKGDKLYIQRKLEPTFDNTFWAEDMLVFRINGRGADINFNQNCNGLADPISPIDLSELLTVGVNTIEIELFNNCGDKIGCSDFVLTLFSGVIPMAEIEAWRVYEATVSDNPISMRGFRILQGSRTVSYELSDGQNRYNAILDSVNYNEDNRSNKIIFYTLTFKIGGSVFKDKYGKCYPIFDFAPNLQYSPYLDNNIGTNILGLYLGQAHIIEEVNIKKVDIYGAGIDLPSWVSVNGVKKYWHYQLSDNKTEKLTWSIGNTNELFISSPNYQNKQGTSYGSSIKAICTDILVNTMGLPDSTAHILATNISLEPITAYSGGFIMFTAKLLSASALTKTINKPIIDRPVQFYLSGNLIGTAITNDQGIAKFPYRVAKSPGNYVTQALFVNDTVFEGCNIHSTLSVQTPPAPHYTGEVIIKAFYRPPIIRGEHVAFGPFTYEWDGIGDVYLLTPANNYTIEDLPYADDALYARTEKGSVGRRYDNQLPIGAIIPGPPLKITPILTPGSNTIEIGVDDIWGSNIAINYDLAIVRTINTKDSYINLV
jgi:hypothetical protein